MRLGNPNVAIDSKLEEEGKWIDFPKIWWHDEATPMRAKLRGAKSKRHQLFLRNLVKDLTADQINEREPELRAKLSSDLVVEWEGWFDLNDVEISYSSELCLSILLNPDNRRVLDFITRTSDDQSVFDAKKREEVEKNLLVS